MARSLRIFTPLAAASLIALIGPSTARADVGCSNNQACVARVASGASGGYSYQFQVADPNLGDNYYDSEGWKNGPKVNDNVKSLRNRNAAWYSICVYKNYDWTGGSLGRATFKQTWVEVSTGASSIAMWQVSSC